MSIIFRIPPKPSSEEVELTVVFQSLWRQKVLIAAVTLVVGALAGIYAFSATPEFQVVSVLRPAAINDLDALNRSGVYGLPAAEALNKVGASLESYDTRLSFFRARQSLFKAFERPGRTLEQSFEEFNRNSINLILPDPKKADSLSAYIKLEMSYPKGIDGVTILNEFIEFAIATERRQISADLNVIINNRLNEIQGKLKAVRSGYEIDKEAKIASLTEADVIRRAQLQDELKALRGQLKAIRGDRLALLNEAIGIAKSLGIKKPTTPSSLGDADRSGDGSTMRTEINNQQIPLYFMGIDALEAEKNALIHRKSDDFTERRIAQIAKELQLLQSNRQIEVLNRRENEDLFLSNIEPLRAEEARLRSLNIDFSRLKLVTIDKQALEPLAPIKPKKALILAVGLILGGIIGILITLIRTMVVNKRQRAMKRAPFDSSDIVIEKKAASESLDPQSKK
ncbi:GNVR domain-containing protein [Pseudomonas rhodesiae]|uniref:Chain-length determining protein n=1 Tax=Pseudomonas rhodesiae TaxID=76760 RepID=A0A8I1EB02_9PSED|nr:GNVR domain-containing protein [Pseudomonas rhodesiae]MBI6627954.1 chain-length determining protein [Pseudomonas rhodesiae]NMY80840.1 chain-length determining protein [Pseudomonas rhodesiae]NMZ15974.1 chain-length determining protein [Pseudomonas rhodesiae]